MSEPRSRFGAVATAWACCAAAFVVVALLVRRVAPHGSGLERMDVKLDHFARHAGDYSAVFLGSSRTMRGFVPELFDARVAEHGLALRSFNFGVPGARVTEMIYLLERMRELRPSQLRYVFVDPEDFEQIHDTRNVLAQSGIVWHDPATTWLASRHLFETGFGGPRRNSTLLDHWRACAFNALNVGRTARWVNTALGRRVDPTLVADSLGARGDGHTALFDDQDTLAKRRRRFERGRAEYEALVERYRELKPPPGPAPTQFAELVAQLHELIHELGATPVFVIQPALSWQWDLIKLADAGKVDVLLRYDDPELHPELFAHEQRFDSRHLNDAGAAAFTRKLADDFAAWVRSREGNAK